MRIASTTSTANILSPAPFLQKEEEYLYSSCCDQYGTRKGLLVLSEEI
ncbi:MAG: hypothetical protein ACKODM_01515 [Cytophagales bacterium]